MEWGEVRAADAGAGVHGAGVALQRPGPGSCAAAAPLGLLCNVAVALGKWGAAEAVPAPARALEDPQPLVRGHAAWALGRIGTAAAWAAIEARAALDRASPYSRVSGSE